LQSNHLLENIKLKGGCMLKKIHKKIERKIGLYNNE